MLNFTKAPSKIIVLEVPEDKCDGLIEAMQKRAYTVHVMDREGRKKLVDCPGCKRRLAKESSFTINEHFLEALTAIAAKMSVAKTVIITNKENPRDSIPPVEHPRCVEIDPAMAFRAEAFGLIKRFQDGDRVTHYVTTAGLEFLKGEKPASPCTVVTLDGEVVETSGELLIESVKFKDEIRAGTLKRAALDAVKRIPEQHVNFVINGQMSLI